MKFSEAWLREWVNPDISTQEMCDQLTMAGLEVDGVESAAGSFTDVVVARVESLEKHPDADKLNVCQVTDGSETRQIVCGAANVRAGLKVPLARVGAVLPGPSPDEPFKIKPAKLRGVESFGMLCSEKELGLADSADGLMELPDDAPVGTSLRDYLLLDDSIVEVDLTPNRGDCLSIAGIARELGVLNRCSITEPEWQTVTPSIDDTFPVEIAADDGCPHYVGRVVRGVNARAETPLWMLERLRRGGIRGLSPIVDITNYILLELGQPMHAFDRDKLTGKIVVRYSESGEKLTLLDGKIIDLQPGSLVIADQKQVLALAGVMGGEDSAVTDGTVDIFLESAFFRPELIAGKARAYGLHTDSSHRFERGVDPELQVKAIERATELVIAICGGQAGPVVEQKAASLESRPAIHLRSSQIGRILGIEMPADQVTDIFQRLGMTVETVDDGWQVIAPSFRFDITIEADLLEELVRVYGYNNIPRTQPSYKAAIQPESEHTLGLGQLKQCMIERGYFEAISYSFVDPAWQKILAPEVQGITLANPLSSEMSVMRTTMWSGLLGALKYNINRQQSRVRLFETGLCFLPQEGQGVDAINQQAMFAGVACGDVNPQQWATVSRRIDFFDIKADVEALLRNLPDTVSYEAAEHPALHPGQSARIRQNGEVIGWLGALHPSVQKALDIDPVVYVFEIQQAALVKAKLPAFMPLSRFPEVRRDLAVTIDENVPVAEIMAVIEAVASEMVKETQLFDIYQGKGVEDGRKSVAFGLILQEFSRTLTDHDVESEVENIVSALNQQFAATLRE